MKTNSEIVVTLSDELARRACGRKSQELQVPLK